MTATLESYDYSALRNQIKKSGYTYKSLADKVGMGRSTLYTKLGNQTDFTQGEIINIASVLNLSAAEVVPYFFTKIVRKTVQK